MGKPVIAPQNPPNGRPATTDFADAVSIAVEQLREALLRLLDTFPDVRKAADVARVLGLERSLAWKLWRTSRAANPLDAVPFLVSLEGYTKLIDAARQRQAPKTLCENVRAAAEKLTEATRKHAGDRTSLEIMAARNAEPSAESRAVARRKATFMGNSEIFGVQAQAQYVARFIAQTHEADHFDAVRVQGLVGLRRMRPNARWSIRRTKKIGQDGTPAHEMIPIDPRPAQMGIPAPVLLDFSSSPLPEFSIGAYDEHFVDTQICKGQIGRLGESTIFVAERLEHGGLSGSEPLNFLSHMFTPARAFVCDLYLDKAEFRSELPTCAIYSQLGTPGWFSSSNHEKLPIVARTESIDVRDLLTRDVARSDDIPRCSELARYVCQQMNWDPSRFIMFRTTLAYPPIPTMLSVLAELTPSASTGADA